MPKLKLPKSIKKLSSLRNNRSINAAGVKAGQKFDKHVVERFFRLKKVRRPVVSWVTLIIVLTIGVFVQTRQLRHYYIDTVPISGGVLREAMVGEVTNVNPLYLSNSADRSLSKLIFSSLVKFDGRGKYVGDLAKRWRITNSGTTYIFTLKDNAHWHDGRPVTADDVVFTFDTLQHPDSSSTLTSVWHGVKVEKISKFALSIKLPNAFAPFLESLSSVGIIPKHILEDVAPDQLRGHRFNLSDSIGSGPFRLVDSIYVEGTSGLDNSVIRFRLAAHEGYHFGKPKLDNIYLYTYQDRERMIADFNDGSLTMIGGLVASDIPERGELKELDESTITQTPASLDNVSKITLETQTSNIHSIPRSAQVMLFMNMDRRPLNSLAVRTAISYGVDRREIVKLSGLYYNSSRGPLLRGQIGYSTKFLQPGYNPKKARQLLNSNGWKLKNNGYRYKKNKRLELTVISQADDILPEVLVTLQQQLKKIGVFVKAKLVSNESIQQDYLSGHNYQAVLYGINSGSDPDQFAFWHSSQRGLNGRNLSKLNSAIIDAALEAGRNRTALSLRKIKYLTFQSEWRNKVPAVALYQPSYIYANKKQVRGVELELLTTPADRYHNVYKWTVNIGRAQKLY